MTERTRVSSRRSPHAALRFTPADETRPPLLTVPITPTSPEGSAMPRGPRSSVDHATIRQHLEAGEAPDAVAAALQVPLARVQAIQAARARAAERADPAPGPAAQVCPVVLDPAVVARSVRDAVQAWVAAHVTVQVTGAVVQVTVPPWPTRWRLQADQVVLVPDEGGVTDD